MGFWTSIGNAFKGINPLNLVGDVLGAGASIAGTAMQNNANKKLMEQSQQFTTSEREASQNYQTSEREAAQDYATQSTLQAQSYQTSEREAQNQWQRDMYEMYETPQARAKALADAGFNPMLALDGSGIGSVGASSGSSGGSPTASPSSGGAPSGSTVAPPYQDANVYSQAFQNMANVAKTIAEAKHLGIDTKFLEETYKDRVQQLRNQGVLQELEIDYSKLNNKNAQAAFDKLVAETKKTNADIDVIMKQLEILAHEEVIKGYEKDKWLETWQDTHDVSRSTVYANEQAGWLSEQQTVTEFIKRDVLESEKAYKDNLARLTSLQADIESNDKEVSDAVKEDVKQLQSKVNNQLDKHIELLTEEIEIAKKQKNWFVVSQLTQALATAVGAATGVYVGTKAGKSGRSAPSASGSNYTVSGGIQPIY